MDYSDKTKEQLIKELVIANTKISEYEKANQQRLDKNSDLRKKAENLLKSNKFKIDAEKDVKELIQELNIYQFELEIQNDQLKQSNDQILLERQKFKNLYYNAPVAYLTIEKTGNIIDFNRETLNLINSKTGDLKNNSIYDFISDNSKFSFSLLLERTYNSESTEVSQIDFKTIADSLIFTHVQAITYYDNEYSEKLCRLTITDITSQKKEALSTIKKQDIKHKIIFNNINDVVSLHKIDDNGLGRIIEINDRAVELFGYSKSELLLLSPFNIIENINDEEKEKYFLELKDKGFISFEAIHKRKDGRLINCEVNAKLFNQDDGDYLAVVIRDITERKKSEEKLKEQEKQYRLIANNITDAIWLMDFEGNLTWVSPSAKEVYKYDFSDLDNLNIKQFLTEESYQQAMDILKLRIIKEKQGIKTKNNLTEQIHIKGNGEKFWVEIFSNALRDDDGNIIGVIGVSRDITERKYIQDKLIESEKQFRTLFNSINDPVFLHKEDEGPFGKFTEVNNSAIERYGYTKEEFLNLSPADITKETDEEIERINKNHEIIQSDGSLIFQVTHITKDNKYIPVEISSSFLILNNTKFVLSVARDISDRIEAKEKIDNLNQRIENAMTSGKMAWWELELPSGKVFFNEEKTRMLGYKKEDFITYHDFTNLIHPDDYDNVMNQMKLHIGGKAENYFVEYRIKNNLGEYLWYRDHGKIIKQNKDYFKFTGITSNITQIKNVQLALNEEREQFLSLLDAIPENIYVADPDTFDILYANKSFRESIETNKNKKCYEVIFNKKSQCEFCNNNEIFNSENPLYWEFKHPNNRTYYKINKAIKWTNGKKVRFELAIDITQLKQTEEKLKESENRLDLFFRSSKEGFFFMMLDEPVEWNENVNKDEVLDYVFTHQRITKINKAMLEQYKAKEEDFIGLTPSDFFSHDIEYGKKVWRKFFDEGILHIDTTEKRFDQTDMIVNGDYICLYDDKKRITGHFGTQRDVTQERTQQAKIRENEERFRAISEYANEGIILIDQNGNITYANPAVENIFEFSVDELLGSNIHQKLARNKFGEEENENFKKWQKTGKGKVIRQKQFMNITTKTGKEKTIQISISSIYHQNSWNAVGIIHDVTQEKEAEEKLIELNASKDKFFSIIAHDLRSPFSGFMALSELLNQESENIKTEELKQISSAMVKSANSVYNLLDDLLKWANTQSGNVPFEPEEIDLYELIFNNIYLMNKTASKKDVKIVNNCEQNLIIKCDRNMITSVIRNLLDNAIKFSNPGDEINVSFRNTDEFIAISVKDNGKGMEEDLKKKLFKVGSNIVRKGTKNEKGSGLGLLLVKEFLNKHNGDITVESAIGEGSTFTFTLPKNV